MSTMELDLPQTALIPSTQEVATHDFILTFSCPDQVGILSSASEFLSSRGLNIREHQQFDDVANGKVHVRTAFRTEQARYLSQLRQEFEQVAQRFDMRFAIHDAAKASRLLLMVSKQGHCLNDLIFRWRTGALNAHIALVVSNHDDLRPMAEAAGIPYIHLPINKDTKAQVEAQLLQLIEQHEIDLVVLARYMQIFSDDLSAKLSGKAINIHHSFLPGFKGAKPYHQAHARGVKMIGATAHYVTADLDEGPIIEQEVIRVNHAHDPRALSQVGQSAESQALSRAVQWHCEHRVLLDGHSTIVFQ